MTGLDADPVTLAMLGGGALLLLMLFPVLRRLHHRSLLRQRARLLARLHADVVGLRQRREFAQQLLDEVTRYGIDRNALLPINRRR